MNNFKGSPSHAALLPERGGSAALQSPLGCCRYNGFTYEEALLNPIADALGSVAKPFTKIYFALQVRRR